MGIIKRETEIPSGLDCIDKFVDLADPNRSYNLIETMLMKTTLEEIDKIIVAFQNVKTKIAANYSRTIGEYQEAGILESDGVVIKLLKEGRATFNEQLARKLFPNECNAAQTEFDILDEEMLARLYPEAYKACRVKRYNLTLTDLRKKGNLTQEQLESIITRAPNTYGVDLKE